MLELKMRKYAACSHEEKQSCLAVIEQIFELAKIARDTSSLGSFAGLEAALPKMGSGLLYDGIALVVDGTDADLVSEILGIAIMFSHKTGAELLKQLIIRDGVYCIQKGYNPAIIKFRLMRFLGEDFLATL